MQLKFPSRGSSFHRAGAKARNVQVNGLNIPDPYASTSFTSSVSATSVLSLPVGQTTGSSGASSSMGPSSTSASSSPAATPAPFYASSPIQQGPAPSANPGPAQAAADGVAPSKSALSRGAMAAIVAVSLIVLLAVGIWLYRMWSIRKRQKLRDWWVPEPFLVPTTTTTRKALGDAEKAQQEVMKTIPRVRPPSVPLPPVPAGCESDAGTDSARAAAPPVPALPVMYQRTSTRRTSSILLAAPPAIYSPPRSARAGNIGVVKSIFEPRMPDELRIRVGEALRVLAEYDDGWAFCESARGERGMIPLECLDRGNTARVRARSLVGAEESLAVRLGRRSVRKSSLPSKKTQG